jgi:hypothetical protein
MSASGRRQTSISTLPSFAFPSTADIAASALNLVAIDMGRPIACQEQDGIGGLSNWPIRPSGAISSNLELHAKAA